MEMPVYRKWITSNPNVLFGKPAIRDTRIPVQLIEAVHAALAFAADTIRSEVVYPLEPLEEATS